MKVEVLLVVLRFSETDALIKFYLKRETHERRELYKVK